MFPGAYYPSAYYPSAFFPGAFGVYVPPVVTPVAPPVTTWSYGSNQYSRRELLDLVLDFVGENDDPSARNTAERLLNLALQNIWIKMPWRQFDLAVPYTFATAAGTVSYPLPPHFGRVRDGVLRNATTGARILPATLQDLQALDPSYVRSGEPGRYAIGGTVGVDRQVAAVGEALTAVSDSAFDTNVRLGIAGVDTSGVYQRLQFTLAGLTPVSLGTWSKVIEVVKAAPLGTEPRVELTSSTGAVTVTGTSAVVRLQPYDSAVERLEITLWPTAVSAQTISVPMSRLPQKLLFDADLCPLNWGPALLEEMHALWLMQAGEIKAAAQLPRMALLDLIALENSNRYGVPSRTRPFLG